MPSESGVTSRSSIVFTPRSRILAWTAAPSERRARGAADEHDFVHVRGLEPRVGKRLFDRAHGAVDNRANERFERPAREFVNENCPVWQAEPKRCSFRFGKLVFHGDQRFSKFLGQFAMGRKIDLVVLKNQLVNERLEQIVNVVAAEMRVAVGREHLINIAVARGNELEDGDVESAAAKIVNRDAATLLFVQAVGQSRGSRLVDEAENFEASNPSGVLRSLALRVVEISGHGDDRAIHGFAKISFGPIFQLAKDKRGDFRWRKNLLAEPHADDVLA